MRGRNEKRRTGVRVMGCALVTVALIAGLAASRGATAPPDAPLAGITTAELDATIHDKRYVDLRAELPRATQLAPADRAYFECVLSNHTNDVAASTRLLDGVLSSLRTSGNIERLRVALRIAADDYAKLSDYGRAADAYRQVLLSAGPPFTDAQRRDLQDDADQYELLRGQPGQRAVLPIVHPGTTANVIDSQRNRLGLLEIPLTVGAAAASDSPESWVFDTGANISTIVKSTAERLHVKLVTGKASVQGIGGAEIPMQVGVIPEMHIAGAVISNVAVLVLDDRALNVGAPPYQIRGIVGFPVIEALGRLTFGPGNHVTIGGPSPKDALPNLYMEELTPLVAADTDKGTRLFTFDSGANESLFTHRYYDEHADLAALPSFQYGLGGADGVKVLAAKHAPKIPLRLGDAAFSLSQAPVLSAASGNITMDAFYGNLGQDILQPFTSYTIDFSAMQFTMQK